MAHKNDTFVLTATAAALGFAINFLPAAALGFAISLLPASPHAASLDQIEAPRVVEQATPYEFQAPRGRVEARRGEETQAPRGRPQANPDDTQAPRGAQVTQDDSRAPRGGRE